jgi:hypothetical protein
MHSHCTHTCTSHSHSHYTRNSHCTHTAAHTAPHTALHTALTLYSHCTSLTLHLTALHCTSHCTCHCTSHTAPTHLHSHCNHTASHCTHTLVHRHRTAPSLLYLKSQYSSFVGLRGCAHFTPHEREVCIPGDRQTAAFKPTSQQQITTTTTTTDWPKGDEGKGCGKATKFVKPEALSLQTVVILTACSRLWRTNYESTSCVKE